MPERTPDFLQTHILAADSLAFSLDEQREALERSIEPGGHKAITLLKEHGVSVVLIVMDTGSRIEEHRAPGVVTIQVLKGRIQIASEGATVDGTPGTLLAFGPSVLHSLSAAEAGAVLLTVSPAP